MPNRDHFLRGPASRRSSRCGLRVSRTGALLAASAELALDSAGRRRGLLGRDSLAADEAMVIAPSESVHTFGMRFAIDVIFVSRQGRVLKIREHMQRSRISVAWRAFAVIEMSAGSAARHGLRVGDVLSVEVSGRHLTGASSTDE